MSEPIRTTVPNPDTDPRAQMMAMLNAPIITQLLVVAAELKIADRIADGHGRGAVEELAAHARVDPDALHRVLRALASVGVFREVAPRVYESTALAETLREDAKDSVRFWTRLWGLPERQAAIGALLLSVRTGRPAFEHLHGTTWWSHLATHPSQATVFHNAMDDLARQHYAATVARYDLSRVRQLVDVGGGLGQLVAMILHRYPKMTAVLFDQPGLVQGATLALTEAGVADRVRVDGGDFFTSVPSGADAYLLSLILHDWTDEQAVTVLTNIRRAMREDGELLIIDAVIPDGGGPHEGKLRDIIMLALHPGRERTEREFVALFDRAGLRHKETLAVTASAGLIIAVPHPA